MFSEDDFVDFCVAEAICLRAAKEQQEAAAEQERVREIEEWKKRPVGSGA